MATQLAFSMVLKSGRHVDVAGQFTPYRGSHGYPGDPPEPAEIDMSKCKSQGIDYEPTEDELEEIIDRAQDVYYEGMGYYPKETKSVGDFDGAYV